ncbi:MAG TPA: HD domain-containing protein [Candidatus Saccharimonadales bacterium]|nr:HD domain-containing protein [Candidatus Saccharimonadales bacterium]
MAHLIEKAAKFAADAHEGQRYGTGDPYIMHPTQVADLARRMGYDEIVEAACYLHDVIEDTEVGEADLRREFPDVVVDAVLAVTYTGTSYTEKITQALRHPVGHVVKFCDVSCNFANSVLYGVKPGKKEGEVIPRRAGYLARLHSTLPTPQDIKEYIKSIQ